MQKALLHLGPRGSGHFPGFKGFPAAIQLLLLGLGDRQCFGLAVDAVPELLGEQDALGNGELGEVERGGRISHRLPSFSNSSKFPAGLSKAACLTASASWLR